MHSVNLKEPSVGEKKSNDKDIKWETRIAQQQQLFK